MTMPVPPGRQHVYVLPGRSPREKCVVFPGDELPLTVEAELWVGTPVADVLSASALLSSNQSFGLRTELGNLTEVLSAEEVGVAIRVTVLGELLWPKIYATLVKLVAEMYSIHESYVILHDLTNDAEMNIYVVGEPGSNVRYYAATHRPLTAREVEALLEQHMFDYVQSVNDMLMAEHIDEILRDIQDLAGVDEAELEVTLICVTATSPDNWDEINEKVAKVIADHILSTMEEMRIHDMTTAA